MTNVFVPENKTGPNIIFSVLAFEFHPLEGERQIAMDNPTNIYYIDGTGNSVEKNLPASKSTIFSDNEDINLDHKLDSTDGSIPSPNVKQLFIPNII